VEAALGGPGYRRHHCGYIVGIGFPPSWVGGSQPLGIRPGGTLRVREGMVFRLMSWILGQEIGDYGVSDTVLVAATDTELLTATERAPRLIG
jgi:Xaa-Pro dipeptidase